MPALRLSLEDAMASLSLFMIVHSAGSHLLRCELPCGKELASRCSDPGKPSDDLSHS